MIRRTGPHTQQPLNLRRARSHASGRRFTAPQPQQDQSQRHFLYRNYSRPVEARAACAWADFRLGTIARGCPAAVTIDNAERATP
jgi:hypothetical protein